MKHGADNTLQVAMELERLGQTFYESLSLGCGHAQIAALAASIAKTEEEHIETFRRMRETLPEERRGPDLSERELFTATMELRKIILPEAGEVCEAVLASDLGKTLDMAIAMESRAVAFYSGLASNAADFDGSVLTDIVNEEKEHLAMLEEARSMLSAFSPGRDMPEE